MYNVVSKTIFEHFSIESISFVEGHF